MSRYLDKVVAHAEELLPPERRAGDSRATLIKTYKRFLKLENHRIRLLHNAGEGGIATCSRRAELLDVVLVNLLGDALAQAANGHGHSGGGAEPRPDIDSCPVTLVAIGGYGRGQLNPCSDIDLLFLTSRATSRLSREVREIIEQMVTLLWDVGFKVGHAVRSVDETIRHANEDVQTKTSLIETRLLHGDRGLFDELLRRFQSECIEGREAEYLENRLDDLRIRHAKHDNTVFLQEPHVKNGCGGLRDYQNLIWVAYVKCGVRTLEALQPMGLLTVTALKELQQGYDFLLRVRSALHYAEGRSTDILTLRLQGVVANQFRYPQRTILRRIEAFMRDYYTHTRNILNRGAELMDRFSLEMETHRTPRWMSFLARRRRDLVLEEFDGFHRRQHRLYPLDEDIFKEDPARMMRMFQHAQVRGLRLSPELYRLVQESFPLIDRSYRYNKAVIETFLAIISRKGQVASSLRQMHRTGFLGRYLPEFGELTCLVQHEFFHRYTADEHTLACIDQLDALLAEDLPANRFYRQLFQVAEDPVVLYLALLMHDAGRAAGTSRHEDASAVLASRVCKRMRVTGLRRELILFLVDHHLTLWRTATSRNLDDPEVVREFAQIMRNPQRLNLLLVLSYADSKGTNDEAWNSWKESLVMQLYRNTMRFFEDASSLDQDIVDAKAALREKTRKLLNSSYREEIDAHFDLMPDRYFYFRQARAIAGHVELFRDFFKRVLQDDSGSDLSPVLSWTTREESASSEVTVTSWDRPNLLANIAGAFAAHQINVLAADIFQRGDDLVLDIFQVCTLRLTPVTSQRTIDSVNEMVRAAFLDPDFSFEGRIKRTGAGEQALADTGVDVPRRVYINPDLSREDTVVEVQTIDRLGLLFDVFRTLADMAIETRHARVATEKGAAIDSFYLRERHGGRITDPDRLGELQRRLEAVVI